MNNDHPIKVKVYWNLHKKVFSVQHKGIVIAHAKDVYLALPSFRVSEAGRQRVLATKRKNVHAFVVGMWYSGWQPLPDDANRAVRVTYNPYKYTSFVTKEDENPVDSGKYYAVWMTKNVVKNIPEIYALPRPTP